MTKIKLYFSTA